MTRDLEKMLAWMRANGVIHCRKGEVELTIDPNVQVYADDGVEENPEPPAPTYDSPFDDPLLYEDGVVPTLKKHREKD